MYLVGCLLYQIGGIKPYNLEAELILMGSLIEPPNCGDVQIAVKRNEINAVENCILTSDRVVQLQVSLLTSPLSKKKA